MPATSEKQRVAAAIAEHHPDQLYARNRSMLKMSKKALHEYAETKGLGKSGQRHDHTPANGFAHAGTTREGTHLSSAKSTGRSAGVVANQEPKAFANSGTSKAGPRYSRAASTQAAPEAGARPTIRRADGFKTNMTGGGRAARTASTGSYSTDTDEAQERDVPGEYSSGRPNQDSPTQKVGTKPSPAPKPPGAVGKQAFRDIPAIRRPKH